MNKIKTFLMVLAGLFISHGLSAQNAEMADTMRSEGKIYVVVAIVVLILLGLVGYLFLLDRKVSSIEKKLTKK